MSRRCIALTLLLTTLSFNLPERCSWPQSTAAGTVSRSSRELDFQGLLIFVPVMLLSFTAHEYAHARVALHEGDQTAYLLGRVTWNPIKHIDPFLTVILPLVMWFGSGGQMVYGGAKPVPTDPRNYRHLRRGDILVSLAGVTMNLVLAIGCALVIPLLGFIGRAMPVVEASAGIVQTMAVVGLRLNLILVVFNVLPLPPLDGSHVMKHFLPPRWSVRYQRYGGYAFLALILSMWLDPRPVRMLLSPALGTSQWVISALSDSILPSTGGGLR